MSDFLKLLIILGFMFVVSCVKPAERKLSDRDIDKLAKTDERVKAFYPHTAEFKKSSHSRMYLLNKGKELCSICHGSDLKGGNVKVSCTSCHNYPHPKDWKNKEAHGKVFKEVWSQYGLDKTIKKTNSLLCMHCHDLNSELRKKNSDIDVPGCKKCHKVSVPHSLDFKDPMHHEAHGKVASRYLKECQICHLGDKIENAMMKEYKYLMKPSELELEKIENCANCHRDMKIKNKELKDNSSWTIEGLENAKLKNFDCKVCHKGEDQKAVLIDKKSLESPDVFSCAACHKGNEIAIQKLLINREITEEELETIDQKYIKIIWQKRDTGK